ncbi:MAG: MFS transporter [Azospirillaceae bacterium]|nr:MFS transporter [Azospirillaceae bacterium]
MTRRSPLLILFLIVFIDLVGFGIVIPLLPYYAAHFGASPRTVTLVLATFSLAQFIASPILGRISDRVGRRPVLLLSLAGAIVSYVILGFADALWVVFAARALAGITAGNIATAQAYITDITPPDKRARGMGVIGAAFGLGFIIGPAIGGILAGPDPVNADFVAPALLAAGLSAIAWTGTLLVLPESLGADIRAAIRRQPRIGRLAAARTHLARPVLGRLIALGFLMIAVFSAMESTFALWAMGQFNWGPQDTGMIFAYIGVVAAILQGGLIGRLSHRFGDERLLITGIVALAAGLAALAAATTLPLVLVATTLLAAGFGAANPSLSSLISRQAGLLERGAVMGVFQSASSLSRVLGPVLGGLAFAAWGRQSPFIVGVVVLIPVLLLARRIAVLSLPATTT